MVVAAIGSALLATPASAADWFGQVEVLSKMVHANYHQYQGAFYSVGGDHAIWHATYDLHQEGGMLDCSDGSSVYYTDDITGHGSGTHGTFALYLNGYDYSVSAASSESFPVTRENSCGEVTHEFRGPYPADTSWSGDCCDTRDSTNPRGLAGSIRFKGNIDETIKLGWSLTPGTKPPSTAPDLLRLDHLVMRCSRKRCSIDETNFGRYLAVSTPDAVTMVKGKRRSTVRIAHGRARIRPWHTRAVRLRTTTAGRELIKKLLHRDRRQIKGTLKITDNTSTIASRTPLIIKLRR